jgi:hypothetical protein
MGVDSREGKIMGPEDNPRDDMPIDREEYESWEGQQRIRALAREYFIKGGGGFEDGEDGVRAVTFSFDGMLDMVVAFAEYQAERAKPPAPKRRPNCF